MKVLIIAHTSFNLVGGHERYTHQFANALSSSIGRSNVLLWPVEQSIPLESIRGQQYTLAPAWLYRNHLARSIFHRFLHSIQIGHIIADAVHLAPYVQGLADFLNVSYDVTTH